AGPAGGLLGLWSHLRFDLDGPAHFGPVNVKLLGDRADALVVRLCVWRRVRNFLTLVGQLGDTMNRVGSIRAGRFAVTRRPCTFLALSPAQLHESGIHHAPLLPIERTPVRFLADFHLSRLIIRALDQIARRLQLELSRHLVPVTSPAAAALGM